MKALAPMILAAANAIAGTTDDAIPDSAYTAYGASYAPYVRRVEVVDTTGRLAVGSGCVIGDRWVLTAAHVVEDAVTVSVAGNPAVTVWVHPAWSDDVVGLYDAAVIYCSGDFGLDYYPPLSAGGEKPGDVVSIAGYGVTGRISSGYTRSDGLLRAGTQTIERFERTLIVCSIGRGSSSMEYGIAPGDSGGPLFVGAGSEARVAGINSFTMRAGKGPLRSREGEESAHTRVSLVLGWIRDLRRQK